MSIQKRSTKDKKRIKNKIIEYLSGELEKEKQKGKKNYHVKSKYLIEVLSEELGMPDFTSREVASYIRKIQRSSKTLNIERESYSRCTNWVVSSK